MSDTMTLDATTTIDMDTNTATYPRARAAPWKVTLVDTGDDAMTGGRLLAVREHLQDEDAFCFTYGDGVGDVDITALVAFHRSHGRDATLTAAAPPGRFGALGMHGDEVQSFFEKPEGDGSMSLCGVWLTTANSWPTNTTASGNRWTRFATSNSSRSFGTRAELLGACGNPPHDSIGFLGTAAGLSYRTYRLQGQLAEPVASIHGRNGKRLRA